MLSFGPFFFSFLRRRGLFFGISGACVLLSLGSLAFQSLNMGIDFTGGTVVEMQKPPEANLEDIRRKLLGAGFDGAILQTTSDDALLIRFAAEDGQRQSRLDDLRRLLEPAGPWRRVEFVGPLFSRDLLVGGLISVSLAIGAILIYIFFRFDLHYALAAVLALSHDVLLTVGLFSLSRLEFNITSIAALLTIAGYSINDTVVIFDRIRENMGRQEKEDLHKNIDRALNQTLSRTLRTSLTTLIVIGALILLGGSVLRGFSVALFFGIFVGTYSSVCLAAPILTLPWFRNFFEPKGGEA